MAPPRRAMRCQPTPRSFCQASIAFEVSSVPLSLIIRGFPRWPIISSRSQETQAPDNNISAMSSRHARKKSSITGRMRKRRPSLKASETKSNDQRSLRTCSTSSGDHVPIARLRPPRFLTVSRSSVSFHAHEDREQRAGPDYSFHGAAARATPALQICYPVATPRVLQGLYFG